MKNTYIYQSTNDLKRCFFINNLKNRIIVNIKNINHNCVIEIYIILVFQREFETIERSRVLLIKCTKVNNSLKHLTVFKIIVINFLQCTNEFID